MTGANRQRIVVLLSVVVAVSANAAPTLDSHDTQYKPVSLSTASNTNNLFILEREEITAPADSHLANIAGEILKPPAFLTDTSETSTYVNPLPPVPAASFMVLVGFLCVSLVKDRKVWLAALVGLLWIGQTGFTTLPRLASHLINKRKAEQPIPAFSENFAFFTGDIKVTQYLGLLHYLEVIPAQAKSIQHTAYTVNAKTNTIYDIRYTHKSHQLAIINLLCDLTLPMNCLASKAEQSTYFSPAFVFSLLPRSPPNLS